MRACDPSNAVVEPCSASAMSLAAVASSTSTASNRAGAIWLAIARFQISA